MKHLILFLLIITWPLSIHAQIEIKRDVCYKETNDSYTKEMCRLDISYEKNRHGRPVIVWFHGGGMRHGKKEIPSILTRDGAVVVGVGYRLYPNASVKEILDDGAAAVAWVAKHIYKYGGNENEIYIAGHSAGGYIVDMLGLDKSWLEKYNYNPDNLAAIVPYSGQVITHFTQRNSEGIDALKPTITELAPLAHMRADAPPMLIISGDREKELYGRYEETAYFTRMLKLIGHKDITFFELEGFNHSKMVQPGHFLLLQYIKDRHDSDQ